MFNIITGLGIQTLYFEYFQINEAFLKIMYNDVTGCVTLTPNKIEYLKK